jgi:hypothetical protein
MRIQRPVLFALLAVTLVSTSGVAAVDVHQPLLPPVPLDPLDTPEYSTPVDLEGSFYDLNGGSRVEWYRLVGWYRLAPRVALGGGVSYAGVEQESKMEFGGGPAWVVLTTKLGSDGLFGMAFDIDSTFPIGDENLYPVSSDAASIGLRVRISTGHLLGGRGWIGWYTRRVSPPSQTGVEDPLPDSDWPSGSGVMAAWQARQRRWAAEVQGRYDFAGIPPSFWWQAEATWFLSDDLGLRGGASVSVGPVGNRPMNWGWLVGLRWRPQSSGETGK